jgi:hypothetical protein
VALDWFYGLDLWILYPAIFVLVAGASEFGTWLGRRSHRVEGKSGDIGTLAAAALGLLALLIAFSFSMALGRYDARRGLVLEEANAIGSTANFALMLPEPEQRPILSLLRDYAATRVSLGVPYDPTKLDRDVARSLDLQSKLWQRAVALTAAAPQSLPAYRFVASLNEVNNIHEKRLTALRNHVPVAVVFMLIGTAMVAMGFTGYNIGLTGTHRRFANLLMSLTVALLIMLVIDLDRPSRGLIEVSTQALVDAVRGIGI